MDQENATPSLAQRLLSHYGGHKRAAEALCISSEAFRLWRRCGIPLERAIAVEKRTGGLVTAEEVLAEAKQRAGV